MATQAFKTASARQALSLLCKLPLSSTSLKGALSLLPAALCTTASATSSARLHLNSSWPSSHDTAWNRFFSTVPLAYNKELLVVGPVVQQQKASGVVPYLSTVEQMEIRKFVVGGCIEKLSAFQVDAINELFVSAREEIEYAKEEAETVYFNQEVEAAKKVVDEVLARWDALLASLSDEDRGKLQRSMGLKIEQLKAEFQQLQAMHS